MPKSLKQLRKKRERLKREIDKLDWQIALGMDSPVDATAMELHQKVLMTRLMNAKPLHQVVTEMLRRRKRGLLIAELHAQVLASGYKSAARDFEMILHNCVWYAPNIEYDRATGRCTLIRAGS